MKLSTYFVKITESFFKLVKLCQSNTVSCEVVYHVYCLQLFNDVYMYIICTSILQTLSQTSILSWFYLVILQSIIFTEGLQHFTYNINAINAKWKFELIFEYTADIAL